MKVLSFLGFRSKRRAEKLYETAYRLIEEGEYEAALKIARKLRKLHYSGAFEIEGRAYSDLRQYDDAVRVLREGVERAPAVWLNWLLLGSNLSNAGQYAEAMAAYDRAEQCERADIDLIHLNRAVVALRSEDYEAVLRHLDAVQDLRAPDQWYGVSAYRVRALHELGRDNEAMKLGERALQDWLDHGVFDVRPDDIGQIALIVGEIAMVRGEDRTTLLESAREWWRVTRHEALLSLIRELSETPTSPDSRYLRLVVAGQEDARRGFLVAIEVIADSAEEGLALWSELETGYTFTLEETKVIEPRPNAVKGVYFVSNRIEYDGE